MPAFYITGLYHTAEFNDMTLPPIKVEASDRLDAMARLGATVWTEKEWQEALPDLESLGPQLEPVTVRR